MVAHPHSPAALRSVSLTRALICSSVNWAIPEDMAAPLVVGDRTEHG